MIFIKNVFFMLIFSLLHLNVLASNSQITISSDKQIVDINDNFKLEINISWNDSNLLNINKEIKWLENFNIIQTFRWSSFAFKNWAVNTNISIKYTLLPKKNWNYEIWPFEVDYDWKKISSNILKISVTWTKQNKDIQINPNYNNSNNINYVNEFTPNSVEKKSYLNLFIILFFCLILVVWILFKLKNNLDPNENDKQNTENQLNNYELINQNLNKDYSIDELDKIFREKLQKYWINEVYKKDFSQISLELNINYDKKDDFNNIVNLLNKAKYWNFIIDKSYLIELIKNF